MEDTIAAISTPIGEGGIAIIRVSGPLAFGVADRIFRSPKRQVSDFPTHTIHFGTAGSNGEAIDQVMLTVMRGPRTYTKEDTIEINCHGGILTARKILSLCLQCGARLSEPGEFTKRAFLNGRLDLTQAEGVMDLIRARTDRAHRAAFSELQGKLSAELNQTREKLIGILAHIEAHIDFPEEDISPNSRDHLLRDTKTALAHLQALLATFREGKILREGLPVAIVGRPNVGKSSLLNALLGEDRAIVTPFAGTTRDTLDEFTNIQGIPFRFTDTAGIRNPRGKIETLGVERTSQAIARSDLILHVLDVSRPFHAPNLEIYQRCKTKQIILVLNKSDLPRRVRLPAQLSHLKNVPVSALTGLGIQELCNELAEFALPGTGQTADIQVTINERHRDAMLIACNYLTCSISSFESCKHLEIVSQELRSALDALGEITGKTGSDDILERIFSTFCIGK